MAKKPRIRHANVMPDNKYIGLLHVGLYNVVTNLRADLCGHALHSHLVSCVRTLLRTVLKNDPIGAPAEKVAKAMEREGPGGNALDRIPS
jgi:hypothetical protein